MSLSDAHLPSCSDCQKWLYDLKTGRRATRGNVPVPRAPGSTLPCVSCPKIPRGKAPCPENAVEMTARTNAALEYYHQCMMDPTGILPRDEVVIRNNSLIHQVIQAHDRARQDLAPALLAFLGRLK